ncbi:MAG: hypothetical protein MUE67_11455, partial [Anaerolineales bacterium]|nr:hypothetical protein [Anaerolineales bacterium]
QFKPVHDARLVDLAARGQVAHDLSLADLLSPAGASLAVSRLGEAPTTSLASVSQAASDLLAREFGVQTVAQLAQFGPFLEAQRFLVSRGDVFREPVSAPEELMPQMIGSVESKAAYTTFVKENTLRFDSLDLFYDQERQHYVDPRLAALFTVRGFQPITRTLALKSLPRLPEPDVVIHLGFASKSTQRWVNTGTALGEIVFSLALAPGESRNIAILDWTRSQRTQRGEDTTASEKITNNLFHTRALDELTTVTANEHQNGGTLLAAGTLATAGAKVAASAIAGGVAGAIPGSVIGGAIGAVAGLVTGPGDVVTTLAGMGAGAMIGFGIGAASAIGEATSGAGNAQLGVLRNDTSGDRQVVSDVHQDITERISQNASNIRSLRSNIFVTDEQAENQTLTGRNVTNYNHSHMLNLQYYEVLQRYRSELRLTAAEPLLFLPFRPLDFSLELISDYWSILRSGVADLNLRQKFDAMVGFGGPEGARSPAENLDHVVVGIQRVSFSQNPLVLLQTGAKPTASLLVRGEGKRPLNSLNRNPGLQMAFSLSLAKESLPFSKVAGIEIEHLAPNEEVRLDIQLRLSDEDTHSSSVSSLTRLERKARQDGILAIELGQAEANQAEPPSTSVIAEIERYFDTRRYFFTRMLLLAIEKEQIIDLVEALMLQTKTVINITNQGQADLSGLGLSGFAPRQALPELVTQAVKKDLEGVVTAGLRSANARPLLSSAQTNTLLQEATTRVRNVVAAPSATNRSSSTLAAQVKGEIQAVLASANLPRAMVNTLSTQAADAFRQRFDGLKALPGVATPAVHLSDLIEPEPLAINGNTLVFRMKQIQNAPVQNNPLARQNLSAILAHPKSIADFVKAKQNEVVAQEVFLPTNGVFAEAILGRANASEKVDATRFVNWLDMPIPNAAPRIADLQLQNLRGEALDTVPTVPGSVINISNPPSFPDTTARDALNVLNNGNLFRDLSRSEVLAGVLNNLSSLANNQSQLAGNLAGQAQQEALRQAAAIANKVADLTFQLAQSTPPPPVTDTQKAGALNELLKQLGVAGLGQGTLPTAGTGVPGASAVPGGTPGGDGTPAPTGGNPVAIPESSASVDEARRTLGVPAPAQPAPAAVPVETALGPVTFSAVVEDPLGNPITFTPMVLNALVNGISLTKTMGPPDFPLPVNVRDQAGALRAVVPNLDLTLELPKSGQGKVALVASASDTVQLAGEAAVQVGINQDRLVILRVKVSADQVIVAAADEAEAKKNALELAAADDGSNFPFALGARLKDVADLLRVVPGPQAGNFTVLAPDGGLEVQQLAR